MIFGISLPLMYWGVALLFALMLLFVPFFLVGAIAESFDEPLRGIINIVGSFVCIPLAMCWLYKSKMSKTGKGSAIFWLYCGIYLLFFFFQTRKLFEDFSFYNILGTLVLGGVSLFMIFVVVKTKKQFRVDMQDQYEAEREEDIKRQAEAILLAEKMKNEQK
jgi:hypothetical protein